MRWKKHFQMGKQRRLHGRGVAFNVHLEGQNFFFLPLPPLLKDRILTAEINEKSIPSGGKATSNNARIGNWRHVWGRPVELRGAVALLFKEVGRNGTRTWFLASSSLTHLSYTHQTIIYHLLGLGAMLCSEYYNKNT